jgi:hypothetical protein
MNFLSSGGWTLTILTTAAAKSDQLMCLKDPVRSTAAAVLGKTLIRSRS